MFDIYILIDIHILIAFICFTVGFIFLAQIFEEKIGMELKLVCCFTLIKIEIISTLLMKSIIIIIIIMGSEKEPDMEPPDRPQGAEHQHAVCSLESIQAITQCLTPV